MTFWTHLRNPFCHQRLFELCQDLPNSIGTKPNMRSFFFCYNWLIRGVNLDKFWYSIRAHAINSLIEGYFGQLWCRSRRSYSDLNIVALNIYYSRTTFILDRMYRSTIDRPNNIYPSALKKGEIVTGWSRFGSWGSFTRWTTWHRRFFVLGT